MSDILDKHIWYHPKTSSDMHQFPSGTTATSLRHVHNLSDDDLYHLPESLERVYLACCSKVKHLKGLHHLKNLEIIDIDVCDKITKEALDELKLALPTAKIDTWGCWQLAESCPEVQQQSDDMFINILGIVPPRLWDVI